MGHIGTFNIIVGHLSDNFPSCTVKIIFDRFEQQNALCKKALQLIWDKLFEVFYYQYFKCKISTWKNWLRCWVSAIWSRSSLLDGKRQGLDRVGWDWREAAVSQPLCQGRTEWHRLTQGPDRHSDHTRLFTVKKLVIALTRQGCPVGNRPSSSSLRHWAKFIHSKSITCNWHNFWTDHVI